MDNDSDLFTSIPSQRRAGSVLFADVCKSTLILSDMDPDSADDFLDAVINEMVTAVRAFDGTVLNIQGDGIMAVFGVPGPQEDHALRAAAAGLAIRDRIRKADLVTSKGVTQVRVGVDSGSMTFKSRVRYGTGQDTRGLVVNIAKRIEELAAPSSVTISEATHALLLGRMRTTPTGTAEIAEHKINLFTVDGVATESALARSFAREKRTPLTGRETEALQIERFIAQAERGEAPVLGVCGESGVGKSRLAFEATVRAARLKLPIEEMRGFSVEMTTPFSAMRNYLQRYFIEPDSDTQPDLAIAETTGALGLSERDAEALRAILLGDQGQGRWSDLSPGERRRAIVDGFTRFLLALAREAPFLLVVDDFQYLDAESRLCLETLIRSDHPGRPAVLVMTRPEGAAFFKAIDAALIELEPLPSEAARRLVLAQAKTVLDRQLGEAEVDDIVERSAGNALILEELTKASGSDRGQGTTDLPLAVATSLQSRLVGLSAHALALAGTCSAVGRSAEVELLQSAWQYAETDFDAALAELVDDGVLTMSTRREVRFRHQLMQEACYGMSSGRNLMAMHERIYKAMQSLPGGQVSDQQLYRHAEKAGNLRAAVDHLWTACTQAIRNDAIETAAQLFSDAFRILAQLSDEMDERQAAFVLMAFDPLQQLARHSDLIEPLEAVRDWAKRHGKKRQLTQATAHLATAKWINGRQKEAYALARESVKLAHQANDLPVATYAQFILANVEFACGQAYSSVNRLGRLADSLTGDLGRARFGAISQMGIMARAFRCWYLTDLDQFDVALRSITEAEAILQDTEHDYSRLLIDVGRGYRLLRMGEASEAAQTLAGAHEIALRGSFYGLELSISGWRGAALLALDDPDACYEVTRRTLLSDQSGRVLNHGNYCVRESHARALHAMGQTGKAMDVIDMAVEVARRNFDPISYAYGLHERSRLRRASNDAGWHRDMRASRRLAWRLGMPGLWQRADAALSAPEDSATHPV